ncbi:MAG TPA: AMP-binding protein, partial [Microbacterium sp.]|nr:AMP-binding protein [Microbacterium sp.]
MDSHNPYASRPWLRAYAPGVPDTIDEVTETLSDMIEASIARYRRWTALEFFGAATTYRELGEQIERAAEGLRRLGVGHGDRVALVLPNCPQHVVAFYAVLRLGAIVVEHNPLYTARELRHQFEDHQARFAIAWDKVYDTLDGFPSDLKIERIVSVDITEAMPWRIRVALRLPIPKARAARAQLTDKPKARKVLTWQKLVDARRLGKRHPRPVLDDTALLQYTSGTTGSPKGAILTHRNLRANAMQGRAWVPGLIEGEETFYGVLPLFHAYGMTLCLTFAMSIGA